MIRPFLNSLLRLFCALFRSSTFPPCSASLLVAAAVSLTGCTGESHGPASAGVLTFSESADRLFADDLVRLDGEWEIYWGQLYQAADFANPARAAELARQRRFIQVPTAWEIPVEHRAVPVEDRERGVARAIGFATLRLRIQGLRELARSAGELHLATR